MDRSDDRDSFSERPLSSTLSGCFYVLFVVSVSGILLLMNAILCLTIFAAIPKPAEEPWVARAGQLFYFIAPAVLLVIEWNLLDRLQRLFRLRP